MTTTYFANCIMGNLFHTKETPTLPTAFYVGLSRTEPNIGGENVSEPSDKAYARVQLSSLSVPESGMIRNTAPIEFADSTTDWGKITHFVIYDAPTGGNLLIYNTLDKPRTVQADSQISFAKYGLQLTLKDVSA